MKRASQIINDIQNNKADSLFLDIYQDESMIEFQKKRYVDAIEQYINLYKDEEVEIFSVPGRSEVCGNHTDHQHGQVLATAINLDIITVVSKDEEKVLLKDKYTSNPVYINDLDMKEEEKDTSEGLIRGILYRFKELGYKIGGFKGFSTSNVLAGSGLSSSAAYEGMIGVILSGLYNDMKVDSVEIAKIGQYAENVYFGKPRGLMDQCACAVGGLIHIDFKDNSNPVVEKIDNDFSQYGYSLCIVDVHASHADLTPDYASEYFNVDNCISTVTYKNTYLQFKAEDSNNVKFNLNSKQELEKAHLKIYSSKNKDKVLFEKDCRVADNTVFLGYLKAKIDYELILTSVDFEISATDKNGVKYIYYTNVSFDLSDEEIGSVETDNEQYEIEFPNGKTIINNSYDD